MDTLAQENVTESVRVFRVAVENQIPLTMEEPIIHVRNAACDLHHPPVVRMGGDAGDLHGAAGDVDKEQYVVRDQSPHRADFDGEDQSPSDTPRGLEKRRPAGVLVAFGSGLDAIFSEYIGDRGPADLMSQIGQCALDSRIPPRSVFNGHAQQ